MPQALVDLGGIELADQSDATDPRTASRLPSRSAWNSAAEDQVFRVAPPSSTTAAPKPRRTRARRSRLAESSPSNQAPPARKDRRPTAEGAGGAVDVKRRVEITFEVRCIRGPARTSRFPCPGRSATAICRALRDRRRIPLPAARSTAPPAHPVLYVAQSSSLNMGVRHARWKQLSHLRKAMCTPCSWVPLPAHLPTGPVATATAWNSARQYEYDIRHVSSRQPSPEVAAFGICPSSRRRPDCRSRVPAARASPRSRALPQRSRGRSSCG